MWTRRLEKFYLYNLLFYLTSAAYYEYSNGYLRDFNADWALLSGRIHEPKCVNIPVNLTLCHGIGYDKMRLPNLLEHDTLSEATEQASSWVPLLGIQCHPDTKLFLCSLFSPVCLPSVDRVIWPCRSLCQGVQAKCEGFLNRWGFPWPDMLNCDKFPLDNDLCITQQTHDKKDDNMCLPCNQPDTYEGLVHNFCQANFVVKTKIRKVKNTRGNKIVFFKRKTKFYKKDNVTKKELKRFSASIEGGEHCDCRNITSYKGNQIIMGKKVNGELFLSYMAKWQKKSFKQATRAIRKRNLCKDGLTAFTSKNSVTDAATNRSKRQRDKQRRRERKLKRKSGRKNKSQKNSAKITNP